MLYIHLFLVNPCLCRAGNGLAMQYNHQAWPVRIIVGNRCPGQPEMALKRTEYMQPTPAAKASFPNTVTRTQYKPCHCMSLKRLARRRDWGFGQTITTLRMTVIASRPEEPIVRACSAFHPALVLQAGSCLWLFDLSCCFGKPFLALEESGMVLVTSTQA